MKHIVNHILTMGGLAFLVIGGCGSNPSNCISDDAVSQWLAANGLSTCSDLGPDPCGPAGEGGSTTPEDRTITDCMFKESVDKCGPVDNHGCNVKGSVVLHLNKIECSFLAEGGTGTTSSTVTCVDSIDPAVLLGQSCNQTTGEQMYYECKDEPALGNGGGESSPPVG